MILCGPINTLQFVIRNSGEIHSLYFILILVSNLDSLIAFTSTAIAYLFFIPCIHVVLKTFIPGLPEDVIFESTEFQGKWWIWLRKKWNPDYKKQSSDIGSELKFGGGSQRIMEEFGDLNGRERALTRTSAAGKLDHDIFEIADLPIFAELIFLILKDVWNGKDDVVCNYFKAIKWKMGQLMKLTFGLMN